MEQVRMELNAWSPHVAELKAFATELKRQLVQGVSQVREAESKYFLPFDETQTLRKS